LIWPWAAKTLCGLVEVECLMTDIQNSKLRQVKLLHTAIWALMAGAILLLPVAAWFGEFRLAFGLTLLVLGEFVVLAVNGGLCPLTDIAGRHTEERAANFDIYLPEWLARHNKLIFGLLFVAGEIVFAWQWSRRLEH
jgi:hypothetical protein